MAAAAAPAGGAKVWRLTLARFGDRAFDGEGARRYGGRWNHPGVAVVYCSETLSLAALEYFVHLEPEDAPGLVAVWAELPPDLPVERLEAADLPAGWRAYPAPERARDLGTVWARSGRTAVLSVPSVIIPHERNVVLNPVHPDFARLRLGAPEPFGFDPRMWKR